MLRQLCRALTVSALGRNVLLAIVLSWLSGCASWGDTDRARPDVHLVRVETVKARLHQQLFVLHLRIDNPTDSRLFIRNLSYKVHLGDLMLAQDEVSLWRSVGAHSRRTFKIEVRTNLWQFLKPLAKKLRGSKPLDYRLQADLATGLIVHQDLHVTRSGEIMRGNLKPE
ncbi:LEA type 2 family protein [Pseudomonas sp. S75]|uniref:LEA type 2 family protein n=1 Tax=unclassified Pseudomonas TaxID=196821 RepID=UPI001904C2E7|nr:MULTISPECIES: LEA type 2 family protein [unclassified Pseudomonas]MBJ9975950.1 LEA type 2 family protein [Pseudomonas sp. S30]MBK0153628.1 LEA type 2 family protein [Pseudomonas sp. S75]